MSHPGLEVPAALRHVDIDDASPLAYSLPSDRDEGIAPLALCTLLADAHNGLVDAAEESRLLHSRPSRGGGDGGATREGRRGRRASPDSGRREREREREEASSERFEASHGIRVDDFAAFLEQQCFTGQHKGAERSKHVREALSGSLLRVSPGGPRLSEGSRELCTPSWGSHLGVIISLRRSRTVNASSDRLDRCDLVDSK